MTLFVGRVESTGLDRLHALRLEALAESPGRSGVPVRSRQTRDPVKRRRYRLNQLINGHLRDYFDC